MRLVKRPVLHFIMCGALGLSACSSSDDDDTGDEGGATDDGGTVVGDDHTYVVDSLDIPTGPAAAGTGLDIDGDGVPDNQLGNNLGIVADFIDLNGQVNEQLQTGGIILLADLKASDLATATDAGLFVYLGANPNPAPCADQADLTTCGQHLQGDGSFEIASDSPEGAVISGAVEDSHFSGGPGEVTIQISIGGTPVSLTVSRARVEVDVADNGLSDGTLGGAITEDNINTEIVPVVADVVTDLVMACEGGAAPCNCAGGTETARGLLDTDNNCVVTTDEMINSPAYPILFRQDLDLLDADGNPGTDGEDDSVSLGLGFTAVTGTFEPPQ